jgi:hypothetical protein
MRGDFARFPSSIQDERQGGKMKPQPRLDKDSIEHCFQNNRLKSAAEKTYPAQLAFHSVVHVLFWV